MLLDKQVFPKLETFVPEFALASPVLQGFTIQAATLIILLFGLGGGAGVLAGGAAGQWLYNRRKQYMAVLMGISVIAGIAPVYWMINADMLEAGMAASVFMSIFAGSQRMCVCFLSSALVFTASLMIPRQHTSYDDV